MFKDYIKPISIALFVLSSLTPFSLVYGAKDKSLNDVPQNNSDGSSIGELDVLRAQIRNSWNIPATAKGFQGSVEIKVEMNRDATVRSATVVNTDYSMDDPHQRALADSALRAILHFFFNSIPLKLPLNRYDQWKTFRIKFDPRDIL